MLRKIRLAAIAVSITALFAMAANAQATTGTVNLSGTISKFVEISSGGGVTLAGNSGGGITTDGTLGNTLAVVINLGELGPSNTATFVKATVPVRLRSNAAYTLAAVSTVTSSGVTTNKIGAADFGFGIANVSRTGIGVAAGTDVAGTTGDPTLGGAVNATTGRFEFAAGNSNLAAFATSTTALNGPMIMNAVPRANTNGLNANAIFAVKPQFYENGTTTASMTLTITAP
jgi:hypothetical protein